MCREPKVYVGGWTDGDPDTVTAAQAAVHQAARSLLSDLDSSTADEDGPSVVGEVG